MKFSTTGQEKCDLLISKLYFMNFLLLMYFYCLNIKTRGSNEPESFTWSFMHWLGSSNLILDVRDSETNLSNKESLYRISHTSFFYVVLATLLTLICTHNSVWLIDWCLILFENMLTSPDFATKFGLYLVW